MKMMLFTLLAFAVVGGAATLVEAQIVCPPGQHARPSKWGDVCRPERGPSPATKTQKKTQ
jgi:hypothetical protein